ncbi:SMI1/KNR4 family protein [Myroides odoratimimus]|uniref:SMI1/KNR4 family protein n=1 Tax=Myroides TaxID=76831 RepID=UPI000245F5C9|nr:MULTISPECIES: SMI1/KNR4 family protein [Myroides]EHO08322.1 hypothetical protein HMPREF9714_02345 [Myroides odoratimimus CCUG 12901]MCO7723296.1 SMI1/KNR4 family protein [Myroides odoratimimus]MDM1033594.1 SMI1/KNR4 family protein [Myroides odoratimimus]MDM1039280.1 SMI1/KNR4 family protein [Myroides odoratimimus]MDM1053503.1 SMI1/KNR4 family protein [Myroides odoratimimus]
MKLFEIEEVSVFLEKKFADVDKDIISELLLIPYKGSKEEVLRLKEYLNITILPEEFEDFIMRYNLGNLTLANIQFGSGGNYINRLINLNNKDNYWYQDCLSIDAMVVGLGDPYTILLSLKEGVVYVVSSEISFDDKVIVAPSFDSFIQGLGTSIYAKASGKEESFLSLIENEFGVNTRFFWEEILY